MSINEPREPAPTTEEQIEVLVEDLFIEEYEVPMARASERPAAGEQKSRMGRRGRGRACAKSLVTGLLALGGLAIATLILRMYQRRATRSSRLLHRFGM